MTTVTARQLLQSRQHFFDNGDKAKKFLGHQASASRWIPGSPLGDLKSDQVGIIATFEYTDLFSSGNSFNSQANFYIFNTLDFPIREASLAEDLGAHFTEAEILVAIGSMQSNKSPGPDGFTLEFYRTIRSSLTPILAALYNDSFIVGYLPPTLNEATISLILKKENYPTLCGSYRPISVLNVDFKTSSLEGLTISNFARSNRFLSR